MSLEIGTRCLVIGCTNLGQVKQMCHKHYKQMQRHGTAGPVVSAKMLNGKKLSAHPLYETWRSITRIACGTQVCSEWRDFLIFVADIGDRPKDAKGLRRKDTNLPFSKTNAYWYSTTETAAWRSLNAQRQAAFRAANPDYARWASIKKNYGLTKEQYTALLDSHNNVCAICKRPEQRTTKAGELMALHVDHSHTTGKIRGLLCHSCNSAIGHFEDSIHFLQSAIEYLQKSNGP